MITVMLLKFASWLAFFISILINNYLKDNMRYGSLENDLLSTAGEQPTALTGQSAVY